MRNTIIDLTKPGTIQNHSVGGKAANLHKLTLLGMPVPPALVIPATQPGSLSDAQIQSLYDEIQSHDIVQQGTTFAVRSSGVGEDGEGNSFAGIFDSYLNIPRESLGEAVTKVWNSVQNQRSRSYSNECAVSVESMGVVIQHMIEADYAGVAFSVCPIEKDNRVALIETVMGCGEALVSSKKTPATIRSNKLTGMMRISRNGADNFTDETLGSIADLIMPYLTSIEEHYGIPVDIEWAIAGDQVYVLQARPITT